MSSDPWTDPDPQPGDFDEDLVAIDPALVAHREGDPTAKARVLLAVDAEDFGRLERLAEARGTSPAEVVSDLIRNADHAAA